MPTKITSKTGRWSAAALILFSLLSFAISRNNQSRVAYDGRTVEEWLYDSDWETERTDAEFALMMLGEKAIEPLRAVLRLKSPSWAASAAWKLPFKDPILRKTLRNVVKKQHAIECLAAVGPLRNRLLPEITSIAEDDREFLHLRRIALRYIALHMQLSTEKSNVLVRLTGDASLGPEAARYLQSFQGQFLERETQKIAQQISGRLDAAEGTRFELLSTTNSVFIQSESLWEAGQ